MLYEIAGLGSANPMEVGVTLQTLKDAVEASSEEEPFWLIFPALEKPTKTFQDIVTWADSQNVYYEVVTDADPGDAKAQYPEAEEVHQAKNIYNKLFQLLTGRVAPGEDKALLVLDDDDVEDIDLLLLINKCLDTNIPVYSMNHQMAPVILEDDTEPTPDPNQPGVGGHEPTAAEDHTAALEAEEAEMSAAAKAAQETGIHERMAAAEAKAAENAAARVEHDENPTQGPAPAYTPSEIDPEPLTRDDLKDFSAPVLREMVKERNVVARDMRSKESLIDALTGTTVEPKPQMPEPEPQPEVEAAAKEAVAKIADDHPVTAWNSAEISYEQIMLDDIEHRFTNHPPVATGAAEKLDAVTAIMIDTASKLALLVPQGREHSLMLTQLEQASMWAKAGIARNQS